MSVYGLTEAGPNGMAMHPEEHPEMAGSIGNRGALNCEVKVVGDDGVEVPAGGVGEIILRCPSMMKGYYKDPEQTSELIRDGWLYTGDVARKDENGYLWIMDRKKDVIISGGVNVYPKEVEDVLARHPGVADVAVIGVPHPEWGETVTAVVVPRRSGEEPNDVVAQDERLAQDLQEFARQHLADFKIPRSIRFAEAIPRNASGKILKHVVREQVAG